VAEQALVFDIKRGSSEDGPGIRTTVFFKGCPLVCVWCQNPEGINQEQELDLNGNEVGFWITLEELLYRVKQDRPFYDSSGGGITLSGGEPARQLVFIHHFLKALKADGIHTAIETCGLFNYERFKEMVLPHLDLIYYDLKLFDDFQSRRHTGCSNKIILENFSCLISEAKIPVIPRIPLIPGITDTEENLSSIAHFLRTHGIEDCTLMPYNPMWQDKLKQLGKTATYSRNSFLSPDEENSSIKHFNKAQ